MAGYVGTKAVLLSTTAANVGGAASIGGALDVGGAFTSQGIDDNADATAITIDSSENVGIGTSSPQDTLHVKTGSGISGGLRVQANTATQDDFAQIKLIPSTSDTAVSYSYFRANRGSNSTTRYITFGNYITDTDNEFMRLDASGNLLVGTTDSLPATNNDASGIALRADGNAQFSRSGAATARFNRGSSDGEIVSFNKDGTTVGSIGVNSNAPYLVRSGLSGVAIAGGGQFVATTSDGAGSDNSRDLGAATIRWDDVFATNGTINTSDRNEKQDIAELSDAEQRVAVAAKGLLRKFRWRDAVEAKGDEARTHFGIIAQDLQAAFAAEGLDAGDYAMFISTTWWETQTEVPAVEAVAEVLDEDGNVVTEAVEAADAYTRTDTYETQEEAPEGATERTRLGVRYSELLAFIIGAL